MQLKDHVNKVTIVKFRLSFADEMSLCPSVLEQAHLVSKVCAEIMECRQLKMVMAAIFNVVDFINTTGIDNGNDMRAVFITLHMLNGLFKVGSSQSNAL